MERYCSFKENFMEMEDELPTRDSFEFSRGCEFLDDISSGYIADDDSKSADLSEFYEVIKILSGDATINKGFLDIASYYEDGDLLSSADESILNEADLLSSPEEFILEEARLIADELMRNGFNAIPQVKVTVSSPDIAEKQYIERNIFSSTPVLRRNHHPLEEREGLSIESFDVRMKKSKHEVATTPTGVRPLKFEFFEDENLVNIPGPNRKALTPSPSLTVGCSKCSPLVKTPFKSLNNTWHHPPITSKNGTPKCADKKFQLINKRCRLSSKILERTPLSLITLGTECHPLEEFASIHKSGSKSKRIPSPECKENIPLE